MPRNPRFARVSPSSSSHVKAGVESPLRSPAVPYSFIALICQSMVTTGKTVSELVAELPRYAMVKRKFPCDASRGCRVLELVRNAFPDGRANDMRRPVEFEGEKLAEVTTYRQRKGSVTGPRRTTETLYRTEDGRLLVYAQEWSRCHGETEHHSMQQVMAEHLEPGGRFSALGRAAGM